MPQDEVHSDDEQENKTKLYEICNVYLFPSNAECFAVSIAQERVCANSTTFLQTCDPLINPMRSLVVVSIFQQEEATIVHVQPGGWRD